MSPRKPKTQVTRRNSKKPEDEVAPEYEEYLERYDELGEGRPKLSAEEFDRLDDELLEMLDLAANRTLSDDQLVRLQELEFLLIDSE